MRRKQQKKEQKIGLYTAIYGQTTKTYNMPGKVLVAELLLRAQVGDDRFASIDIPEAVTPFSAGPQGQSSGNVLSWDIILESEMSVVFVDTQPPP